MNNSALQQRVAKVLACSTKFFLNFVLLSLTFTSHPFQSPDVNKMLTTFLHCLGDEGTFKTFIRDEFKDSGLFIIC